MHLFVPNWLMTGFSDYRLARVCLYQPMIHTVNVLNFEHLSLLFSNYILVFRAGVYNMDVSLPP